MKLSPTTRLALRALAIVFSIAGLIAMVITAAAWLIIEGIL